MHCILFRPSRPTRAIQPALVIPTWRALSTPTCTIQATSTEQAAMARLRRLSGSSTPGPTRRFSAAKSNGERPRCFCCEGDDMKPTLPRFRTGYEQATIPLGRFCLRVGLTPDTLTLISLCMGGVAAYAIAQRAFVGGVALILLITSADVLDGATARAGGTSNPAGMLFDHVVDRYAEFFILLGIMLSGAATPGWSVFALFGMVMASYVR